MKATLEHLVHCCSGDDPPDCPIIDNLADAHAGALPGSLARDAPAACGLADIEHGQRQNAIIAIVKALQVWLLLLLAVLLPVRGAAAAAMLCAPAGVGTQSEVRVMDRALGHHGSDTTTGAHHEHASHDHGAHDHGRSAEAHAGDEDTHGGNASDGSADKCNVCSSFCSVTPMVSAVPTLPLPLLTASTVFPALGAPAIAFLSDGQDRPPRSI